MAVRVVTNLTLDEFRAEVGVNPLADQDTLEQKNLERLFDMACRLVTDRVVDDTPIALKNQAILMIGSYVYDKKKFFQGDRGSGAPSFPFVWQNSGAVFVLRDYLKKPTALIEAV